MNTGNQDIKLDTSDRSSAEIADLILDDFESADRNYALCW